MMDRFRACSPLVALAIASVAALSACEQQDTPQEPVANVSSALGTFQPGDIAVTCMFTQSDAIQITPLVPLDVGADLRYTDREANAAGMFNTGENVDVPIVPPDAAGTTVFPAGTSLFFTEAGLGNVTEQVFLYQGLIAPTDGAASSYQLIWGLQVSPAPAADAATQTDPGWANVRDDANDLSERPTVLVGASVGLSSGAATGFAYDKTKGTTGTKAQLKALISNPANWIPVTPAQANCPGNFTVIPDVIDAGENDSASDAPTGTGGMTGSDAGTDAPTGTGGMTGTDAGDSGVGGATGTGGSGTGGSTDSGAPDVKADTGTTTDAKADTGTGTDAKVDTGTTGGTDAKVDTGTKVDAGKDAGTTSKGSSGCGCSTASNSTNISAGAWVLALAGILMTTRRRRRR